MKVQEAIKELEKYKIIPIGSLAIPLTKEGWNLQATLEEAKKKKQEAYDYMEAAQSDMSYWGRRGTYVQWEAVVNILEAAKLLGTNELPDIPFPDLSGKVVMDAQAALVKWSEKVKEVVAS